MATRSKSSQPSPKPATTLDPTCVVSDAAVLTGTFPVVIGAKAVLHPRSRINSTYGPVTIGEGCIVNERSIVGLLQEPTPELGSDGVELCENVVVEPAAAVQASKIGSGSILEAGSKVGAGATLGKHCRVAPLCEIKSGEEIDDFTVVYGENRRRRVKPGLESYRMATHEKQLEVLKRLIPSNLAKWQ